VLPKRENARRPSKEEEEAARRQNALTNAGFEKVERLQGNVGYIKFNFFAGPDEMARPVKSAMEFLQNVDAFIIDLRTNGGGDPSGVQLFCSHFFNPKPVHLNSLFMREGDKLVKNEFWTLEKLDGPRFPTQPVYVLTSKRTGSGAEECSYNFQQLKRGTIIGEPTWGGANPGGNVRLNDHFVCFIPVGKAENPYSKTNWEGKGVQPDLAVNPAESLKYTHLMALKTLMDKSDSDARKRELQAAYDAVNNTQ
jgi:C-terminal processing protease CtpA/Prc